MSGVSEELKAFMRKRRAFRWATRALAAEGVTPESPDFYQRVRKRAESYSVAELDAPPQWALDAAKVRA